MKLRANRGRANEKELGDIISRKIKDPRIGFVTVTDVQVSGDLQIAKVYISVLGDEEQKENTKRFSEGKRLYSFRNWPTYSSS